MSNLARPILMKIKMTIPFDLIFFLGFYGLIQYDFFKIKLNKEKFDSKSRHSYIIKYYSSK